MTQLLSLIEGPSELALAVESLLRRRIRWQIEEAHPSHFWMRR
jgi:hypothetical protein